MLKIGLIGCGFMGSTHYACYKALSEYAKVTAVADVRREKAEELAKKDDCTIYGTGEELIKSADVDVVDICLPTHLHAKHAVMAMEKGFDVFVEKPVCITMDEANLMLETQRKTGRQVMVGQVIRLWDEYKLLKSVIDSKKYGKIVSAVFKRLSPKPTWSYENWMLNPSCGGNAALDLHIHDVDFVRYAIGEPDEISTHVSRDNDGVLNHIFTMYKFGGALVSVEGCWDYPPAFPFTMEYRIMFEEGTMVFNSATQQPVVYLKDGGSEVLEVESEFSGSSDRGGNISSLGGYYNELKYFVTKLNNKEKIEAAPLDEAAKSLELVLKGIEKAGGFRK